jgi:hypothetical protein
MALPKRQIPAANVIEVPHSRLVPHRDCSNVAAERVLICMPTQGTLREVPDTHV